jgi:hypothetical protein
MLLAPFLVFGTQLKTEVVDTITVNASQDVLYGTSMVWLAYTFVSSKDVIQYEDKALGKIIGKAQIDIPTSCSYTGPRSCLTGSTGLYAPTSVADVDVRFVIDFAIKSNSVVVKVSGLEYGEWQVYHSSLGDVSSFYALDEHKLSQAFRTEMEGLIDDLRENLLSCQNPVVPDTEEQ